MADIEWQLLCKTIETRSFQSLAEARITEDFFTEENVAVFRWMRDHWLKYGESPGEAAYYREWPHDALVETPEPLVYYVDELRDHHRTVLVTTMLDQIKKPMTNGDSEIVVKILAAGLEEIQTEVSATQDDILTDPDLMQTLVDYFDNLATNTGLVGWRTGFPAMDLATGGLQRDQLVTLTGLQKKKKSMLLMCMNIAAHRDGASTLFISFEMSNLEQEIRHTALRSNISLTRLQRGKHTADERKRLIRMMHEMDGMQPMVMVYDPGGTTTVSAIAAKISQYKPDICFIDGTYMMDAEGVRADPGSPQALTSITRSLKRLAQRSHIPIVQTTQSLAWKARGGKLTLDSIGYTSSFGQDSDVVFGVEEVKEGGEIKEQEMLLRILASRNCPPRDVRLDVNLDYGLITEIEEPDYGADDEDD
jgi:hypothetical protein